VSYRACTLSTLFEVDVLPELRLIRFDRHQVVASLSQERRGERALGQQDVPGEHAPAHQQRAEQREGAGNLVGLGVHRVLGEGQAEAVAHGREEMDPRGAPGRQAMLDDLGAVLENV
jgi:hypothetical protein